MSYPFVGQVTLSALNFAPSGYALCNGQLLPINQNQALFSLLGTTYGGDGRLTFALPDLRARTPLGMNSTTYPQGSMGGTEAVTLQTSQIPPHIHSAVASKDPGTLRDPIPGLYGNSGSELIYGPSNGPQVTLNAATVSNGGANQAHPNMQPYLVMNYCIALRGIFPSRG